MPTASSAPAADEVLVGIVAEKGQVTRPAARRDAQSHRLAEAKGRSRGQRVQVGLDGGLQLGLAARLQRQPAQTVEHQQHDLAGRVDAELPHQVEIGHRCLRTSRTIRCLPCRVTVGRTQNSGQYRLSARVIAEGRKPASWPLR